MNRIAKQKPFISSTIFWKQLQRHVKLFHTISTILIHFNKVATHRKKGRRQIEKKILQIYKYTCIKANAEKANSILMCKQKCCAIGVSFGNISARPRLCSSAVDH